MSINMDTFTELPSPVGVSDQSMTTTDIISFVMDFNDTEIPTSFPTSVPTFTDLSFTDEAGEFVTTSNLFNTVMNMSSTGISTSLPTFTDMTTVGGAADGHTLTANDIVGIVMYVVIGVFGIVGNSLVMIVFGLLTQKKTQVNMFIFNQALIDACTSVLLILFGVVNAFRSHIMAYEVDADGEFTGQYRHISGSTADFLCRFWWSRSFLFACFAISTWNLTVMSFERYFAVLHPTTYSRYFTRRNVLIMIVVIWAVAPWNQYVPTIFMYSAGTGGAYDCSIQASWTMAAGAVLGVSLFVWELVIPTCIMGFVYLSIFRTMRHKKHALRSIKRPTASTEPSHLQHSFISNSHIKRLRNNSSKLLNSIKPSSSKVVHPSKNITITLFILFATYVVCWTPNQVTFLQFNFGGPLNFTGVWYNITVCLAFINCCVNPFIYALRLKKFQKGMRMLMVCQYKQEKEKARHDFRLKIHESTSFNDSPANSRPTSTIAAHNIQLIQ